YWRILERWQKNPARSHLLIFLCSSVTHFDTFSAHFAVSIWHKTLTHMALKKEALRRRVTHSFSHFPPGAGRMCGGILAGATCHRQESIIFPGHFRLHELAVPPDSVH